MACKVTVFFLLSFFQSFVIQKFFTVFFVTVFFYIFPPFFFSSRHVKLSAHDCTDFGEYLPALGNRFQITGYPTLALISKGQFHAYHGPKETQAMFDFIKVCVFLCVCVCACHIHTHAWCPGECAGIPSTPQREAAPDTLPQRRAFRQWRPRRGLCPQQSAIQ